MSTHFHYLPNQVQQELRCVAETLLTPGKGILTADESESTIAKRFQEQGMNNSEDTRRKWRLLLFSTAQIEEYISGVVLIDETLNQKDDSGKLLVDYLKERCIIPGIKVDGGLVPLPGSQNEVFTQGIEDLGTRLADYKQKGCEFARWRCVFKIGQDTPSHRAIISNADELARFASICQSHGICPLIEPEVVPEGNHDIRRCEQVTEMVLSFVFRALNEHQVFLEGTVLKPNMVTPGMSQSQRTHPEVIAEATVIALQRTVPPAVPGITFSSGGQTEEEATDNLHAIVCALGKKPWYLTFAFGRALQASAMRIWKGNASNVAAAQAEFLKRAKTNGNATCGIWDEGKSSSDVFSPITPTIPTVSTPKQSGTIESSPTPTSTSSSDMAKTETPEINLTTTAHPEKGRTTKKGLFSFLRKKNVTTKPNSSPPLSSPYPVGRTQKPSLIGRDDEGDTVEPVAYIDRDELSPKFRRDASPKTPKSSPSSLSPSSTRGSPRSERDVEGKGTPTVGISNRVAPTYNSLPDPDTLGGRAETVEWNKSIITYKSCFAPEQQPIVPSDFGLRIVKDFQILRGIRISDSVRLPFELTFPRDSKISNESTIIEEVAISSNRSDTSDQ